MNIKEEKYDPELRKVARKIRKILEKNDIAGSFVVVSKTHSEFRFYFPKWSAVTLKGNELRIKSKREDYNSLEEQKQEVENSIHILCQIRDISSLIFSNMENILEQISARIKFSHKSFKGFYPEDKKHLD